MPDEKPAAAGTQVEPTPAPVAPVKVLKPGDPGYAPPARIAHTAGQVITDLGYVGHQVPTSQMGVAGAPAMPAGAPNPVSTAAVTPPAAQSQAEATVTLDKMIGELMAWILAFPYPAVGETAQVVRFFRDLASRRAAMLTARELGRMTEPDAIDAIKHTPPIEKFQVAHLAHEILELNGIYDAHMNSGAFTLSAEDEATVTRIITEVTPMAEPVHIDVKARDPDPKVQAEVKEQLAAREKLAAEAAEKEKAKPAA